jgi:hypothetical protein
MSPDLFFINLVFAPFILGNCAGASSRRLLTVLTMTIGITLVVIGPWLLLQTSELKDHRFILSGMAALWMFLGVIYGFKQRSYVNIVGIRGYVFTVYPCLMAVCLSSIVVQGLLLLLGTEWAEAGGTIGTYVLYISILLIMMPFAAWVSRAPPNIFKAAAKKKILYIFTIFGLLELLAGVLLKEFTNSLLWWIPSIDPPLAYNIFFSFVVGIFSSIPFYKSDTQIQLQYPYSGVDVAIRREELTDNMPLETLFLPDYQIPDGWKVVQDKRFTTQYNLLMKPPVSWFKKAGSSLNFVVFQYNLDELDVERLKRNAQVNLLAQNSEIKEETFGTRHDVTSYECFFKQHSGYGYIVTFIKQKNEYLVHWFSVFPEVFNYYLPEVEKFIESLQFDIKG